MSNAFSLLNLQESLGNQGFLGLLTTRRLRAKLAVNQPGDVYEQAADRVAQAVVSAPAPPTLQRKCACGGMAGAAGECEECRKKKEGLVQRRTEGGAGPATAPPAVHEVLGSAGQPLDSAARAFLEPRFGHSFGDVRVHTDDRAAKAAQSVDALAFTVGRDVVFGAGQYSPWTQTGRALLAHELTHVVQQAPLVARRRPLIQRQPAAAASDRPAEVDATASLPSNGTKGRTSTSVGYALGAGFGVCSRETKAVPGVSANHSFIDAQELRYGLLKRCRPQRSGGPGIPLATGADLGLPLNPTAAKKSDHSTDPCNKTPHCVPCQPRPGVTDLAACFSRAYAAYPETSEYVVFPGPNSNTFAGTLARACCQNMESAPAALGTVPGWERAPAATIPATCTGPIACGDEGDTPGADKLGGALRGGIAGLLTGGLGGAGIGALLGGLIGLLGGPAGLLAGAKLGALIGGLVGGGSGGTVGAIAGTK